MNILVACEESQVVTIAMRENGHNAFSCDLLDCSGGHPEWHIKDDVLKYINGEQAIFWTMDNVGHIAPAKWDMIIAFPPCTDLASSGARHFAKKREDGRQQRSIEFFLAFTKANCDRIAIENPIGIMSRLYRKPDQIVQPYQFGHHARKSTCLWLKGLPKLVPTDIVDQGEIVGKGFSVGAYLDTARDENGKTLRWNDPRTARIRSKTFEGVGKAMADQWAPKEEITIDEFDNYCPNRGADMREG